MTPAVQSRNEAALADSAKKTSEILRKTVPSWIIIGYLVNMDGFLATEALQGILSFANQAYQYRMC